MNNDSYTLKDAIKNKIAPWSEKVSEDFHVVVFKDQFPCTDGHLLFVPQYNSNGVITDCFSDALKYGQDKVVAGEWDGFNIGLNWGEAAGQTVSYPHIHLIPRTKGDVEDPVGGVRNTIPGKGNYNKLHQSQ
jgi:diadenosine tetraphosphate (Ap4A) HIT family hydrolase